jgi:hypothetical protein
MMAMIPPSELPPLKWPRSMETDPRLDALATLLSKDCFPLWERGSLAVPHLPVTEELEKTLLTLQGRRQLERGLEQITSMLAAEKKGLDALNAKQGSSGAGRISRLLLIADGGSERFYRDCEKLFFEHSDRLAGLRLVTSKSPLIEKLYGTDAMAKVLLISHRDAVAAALWALLPVEDRA